MELFFALICLIHTDVTNIQPADMNYYSSYGVFKVFDADMVVDNTSSRKMQAKLVQDGLVELSMDTGNYLSRISNLKPGDIEAVALRALHPCKIHKLRLFILGEGDIEVNIWKDWGQSVPDSTKPMMDPIIATSTNREGEWHEFDISARNIRMDETDFFWVGVKHIERYPYLGYDVVPAGGTSRSMYKSTRLIDSQTANGDYPVWHWFGLMWQTGETVYSGNYLARAYVEYYPQAAPFYFSDVSNLVPLDPDQERDYRWNDRFGWLDYDKDGWQDVVFYPHSYNATVLMHNDGGTGFSIDEDFNSMRQYPYGFYIIGDVNNDGFEDLFCSEYSTTSDTLERLRDQIMLGDGSGNFTLVENSGVSDVKDPTAAGGFADYDLDGFLDLYIGNWWFVYPSGPAAPDRLFKGNGDGTFVDVTESAIRRLSVLPCYGVTWGDFDNDHDPDIYVGNYGGNKNLLLQNNGDGTFTDRARTSEVDQDGRGASGGTTFGVEFGDYNNDEWLDIAESNICHPRYGPYTDSDVSCIHQNLEWKDDSYKFRLFARRENDIGLKYVEGGIDADWGDFDNDGYQDIFFVQLYGNQGSLYRNRGNGTFEDFTYEAGFTELCGTSGFTWGDFDNDGDLDCFLGREGRGWPNPRQHFFRNEIGNRNNWIEVDLVGTQSNYDAIGTRVTIKSALGTQIREVSGGDGHWNSQSPKRLHFGLGQDRYIESLKINWSSGVEEIYTGLRTKVLFKFTEGNPEYTMGIEQNPIEIGIFTQGVVSSKSTIKLVVNKPEIVSIDMYDLQGRLIANPFNQLITTSANMKIPENTPSGAYFLRANVDGFKVTKKIVVIR